MPSKFWSKNRTRPTTAAVGGGQPHQIPGLPEQGLEQYHQQQVPQQYQQHPQQYYQGAIAQGDPPAYQQQQQQQYPPPSQQQQQPPPTFNVPYSTGQDSLQGTRDDRYQYGDEQDLTDTQEKIKSLRGRFGLGGATRHSFGSSTPGLSRRISLRRPEGEGDSQQSSPQEKRHSFQWSSRGNSTSNLLAVTQEEDRNQLDPPRGQVEANSIQNSPLQHYQSPAALSPAPNDPALQQQVSPLPEQYRQQVDSQQPGPQTYYPPPQLPSPQPHPAPNHARIQSQSLGTEAQTDSRQQHLQQGQPPPPKAPGGAAQTLARTSQDSTRMSMQREGNAPKLTRTDTDKSGNFQGIPPRESSKLPPQQGGHLSQPSASGMAPFGANIVPPGSQGQPYKGGHASGLSESHGRTSPQPSMGNDGGAPSEDEHAHLVKEHKELREKYNKVKKYYFEKEDQVKQLQNSLAHQRLSLSKTSLDDNEYTTRFSRLDGLIAQLAFSIRKSWKTIPSWLAPVVNKDAVATGKQEMTAVGRACITSFLVDELFDKYFHPDLELPLSAQLKAIQNNLVHFAPPCTNVEEEDALRSKVINWRLSTLDGLQELLRSAHAPDHRDALVQALAAALVASLAQHMVDPAPSDLAGGVHMIVELAVAISSHLPLESRDVSVWYPPPGTLVQPDVMKLESGIPPLTASVSSVAGAAGTGAGAGAGGGGGGAAGGGGGGGEEDEASVQSTGSDSKENASPADEPAAPALPEKKRGMFSGIMGAAKKTPTQSQASRQQHGSGTNNGSQSSLSQPPGSATAAKEEAPPPPRVRFAAFVSVQVKGKSVLVKAPVFNA
ncbi:MAG: hypothetical protein M1821_009811 [Bathelium mastoideum]|nr:MAG: hypothetical protein M1821_009811 [Bathelium mastoideum]